MKNFKEVLEELKKRPRQRVAVAAAEDEELLLAVKQAVDLGLVEPILVGDKNMVSSLAEQVGLQGVEIHDAASPEEATALAVELVRTGKARVLMKGLVNTSVYMRAILSRDHGLRTNSLMSLLAVYEFPQYPKLVFGTDSGINVAPNLEQKKDILTSAILAMHRMGISCPKVAALASNELVSDKIIATVEAQALATMGKQGLLPDCQIEGPLSLDIAFSRHAAEHKGFDSDIAGEVDLLLFPNIESGNFLGKSWLLFNQAKWGGIVLGAAAPIILGSRADTAEVKINSIALGCLAA